MRSHLAMIGIVSALGALVACSSSSSPPSGVAADAGPGGCTDTIVNVFNNPNNNVACPLDDNANPLSYDEAITNTCATENLKTGDVEYGQCFEFLLFEVVVDASGDGTKCFYDVSSHALVGLIYSDGMKDQCGGTSSIIGAGSFDLTCSITGLNGGGSGFQACTPAADAGGESSLLGQ